MDALPSRLRMSASISSTVSNSRYVLVTFMLVGSLFLVSLIAIYEVYTRLLLQVKSNLLRLSDSEIVRVVSEVCFALTRCDLTVDLAHVIV